MKINALAALIVLIAASLSTESSFAQYSTVAWPGTPVPGAAGASFLRLNGAGINGACDASFWAELTDAPDQGAWLGKPTTLNAVALRNDVAPGTGGARFSFVDLPWLTPSSEFLFHGSLVFGGGVDASNSLGLWAGSIGALQLLARTGDQAPDVAVGQVFSDFGRWSANSPESGGLNAVFDARLTGPGVVTGNSAGIWAGSPGDVRLVVRFGDPAPGMPGYNLSGGAGGGTPSINQNGDVGFDATVTDPLTGDTRWVAFVGPRNNVQPILRSGDVTADMPAGYEMDQVVLYGINNAGDASGHGTIVPAGTSTNSRQVVWRSRGGIVELVLIDGEQVPGLPAGVVWGSLGNGYHPPINANGAVGFLAQLNGTGVTASDQQAIFVAGPESITMIAREGDPAPGMGAGVTFGDFWESPDLTPFNAMNQVAFFVTLAGAGVTEANAYAVFLGSAGTVEPVVRTGVSIEVATGIFKTVAGLRLANLDNSGNEDGKLSYLNDDGVVVFSPRFTDGTDAIVIWPGDACPNRAPQITSVPPTTGMVGVTYTYDVEATDPDGDTLTYALDSGPLGMFIDAATGLLQWTPFAGQEGVIAVSVSVSDPVGSIDTQTFDILVPFANRAPVITSTPPTSGTPGILYSYDVDATDPDGDVLTYSLVIRPVGMTIDPVSGLIQWTPTAAGDFPVRVRAADPAGLFALQTYTIRVVAGNQPPTIVSTPTLAATEGSPYVYDVDATDPNGNLLTYSLDTAPAGMTIDPATGLIQWTPGSDQLGANAVTVRVGDGNGGFATQSFSIDVAAASRPPTIVSTPPLTATEGSPYVYDVNATDPNGDVITYSLDAAPAGMTIDPATGLVEWAPDSTQLGANAVTVRADDGNGGFATQSFSIDVAAANQLPVADAGGPYTGTVNLPLTFSASDSMDPDGSIVSYDWNFGDGSTGSGQTASHTYLSDGTFVVDLTVTDNSGATATATATAVIFLANVSPVADPGGPYTGTAGVELVLDGSGSTDPDGTIDLYEWDFGDGGTGFGATPGHTYLAVGTYNVTLTVTDDDGAVESAMTTAVVLESPANTAPVCTEAFPGTEIIWPPNHKFVPVSVHGVTDADGDSISISIDSIYQDEPVNAYGDGDTARDGRGIGTDIAELRAERSSPKVPGNGRVYRIGFTANDSRGATCSGSVAVGVPHDEQDVPVDDGAVYDSTVP